MPMKSIEKTITNTIIIQKSKFICKLIPVSNIQEIKKELENIKEEFPLATHYCYAYICNSDKRCSDDGEPSGTAGMPILNVLEKQELNHILCIVIRYFGGIKLGAGGLVRAYSGAVTEALKSSNIVELELGKQITCTFPYSSEKQFLYLIGNTEIINKDYEEEITYVINIGNSFYKNIKNSLNSIAKTIIKKEVYIKKNT